MAFLLLVLALPAYAGEDRVDVRLRLSATWLDGRSIESGVRALQSDLAMPVAPTLNADLRSTIARRREFTAARAGERISSALEDLSRWVRVSLPSDDLGPFLDRISTDARIDRYEEVPVSEACGLFPDDPLIRNQQSWLDQVFLPEAWAAVGGASTAVQVAIVDGGTEWSHPDLLANVALNELEIPGDGIDQDGNGFVDDVHGWCFTRGDGDPSPLDGQSFNARHGTHVAGLAGAVLGNGEGVAGAGGNPRLVLVNAAHPTIDGGIGWGYEGILYAVGRGADIINCSWRTARFVGARPFDAPYSQFEALVVQVAREAGALIVAAVGNDFQEGLWTTPAGYPDVLAVTATERNAEVLWVSANRAPWVDVAAPGQGMISTFPTDQPQVDGAYGLLSGTSMASALTSGVAALARSEHPEWNLDQLRSRIRWTAREAGLEGGVRILRADSLVLSRGRPDVILHVRGLADEDGDGDGLAEGGEIVDLRFDAVAAFESQVGVTVESWTSDPWLVPLVPNMGLPSIPASGALDVRRGIKYWVNPAAPAGHVAQISLRAVMGGVAGPSTSGPVRVRPLAAHLTGERHVAAASANGVLGSATQVVSAVEAVPGLGRQGDAAGFLTKGALMIAGPQGRVSDALMPRVPLSPYKDFSPTAGSLVRLAGEDRIELEYSDRGAPESLGLRVRQEVRLRETANGAYLLVDYGVEAFDGVVAGARWGLALDFTIPAAVPDGGRGTVAERLVITSAMRGIRAQAVEPGTGAGVVGTLVLGETGGLGFSGLAQWAIDGEEGWNIPGSSGLTVDDDVLHERMQPRVDSASLDPTGDRVAILSGALGDVKPGETSAFAVAIAVAASAEELERILDEARIAWESARVGLNPETLASGLVRFSANPFRAWTEISFALASPGPARVTVYDLRGRRVRTLLDDVRRAGIHQVPWDGRDRRGASVASGVYLVRLETNAGTSTERITRVR